MNRLFSNVWVIDSGGLWLTSDSSQTGSFLNSDIAGFRFVSNNSGKMEIVAQSDTVNNVIFSSFNGQDYSNDTLSFTKYFKLNERLFVRTLTAGTGWIYFS